MAELERRLATMEMGYQRLFKYSQTARSPYILVNCDVHTLKTGKRDGSEENLKQNKVRNEEDNYLDELKPQTPGAR